MVPKPFLYALLAGYVAGMRTSDGEGNTDQIEEMEKKQSAVEESVETLATTTLATTTLATTTLATTTLATTTLATTTLATTILATTTLNGSALDGLTRVKESCTGDTDCKCKEFLLGAICKIKEDQEKWPKVLAIIDSDSDGSIDENEFLSLGWVDERNNSIELPQNISGITAIFMRLAADGFDDMLEGAECNSDREILKGLLKSMPWKVDHFEEKCDAVGAASDEQDEESAEEEDESNGTGLEEDESNETETVEVEEITEAEDSFEKNDETFSSEEDETHSHLTGIKAVLTGLKTMDRNMIRHDVDLNKLSDDMGINTYLNFSTLKAVKIPRSSRLALNSIAYGSVAQTFAALLSADFCAKDAWGRSIEVSFRCKKGWKQGDGLAFPWCYRKCKKGYKRFGEHCYKNCWRGWINWGFACKKHWWSWPKGKHIYYEGGCLKTDNKCGECPSGYYMSGLLCVEKCKHGYTCSSDLIPWGHLTCKSHLAVDCGPLHCASDEYSCIQNAWSMIQGLADAVVSSALLVFSFGTSAAATVPAKVVKNSIKKCLKNAVMLQARTITKTFRRGVKKAIMKTVKKEMKEFLKGKLSEARDLALAYGAHEVYALSQSETLLDEYLKKFEKGSSGWEKDLLTTIKAIDPTGIARAIDGSTGNETDDLHKQVANWMTVISLVDPTGIVGAIAGIIKHGACEKTLAKIDKEMEQALSWNANQTNTAPTPAPPGVFACDECEAKGFKPDACDCGYCGSFGGCTFSCGKGGSRVKCSAA